MGIDALQARFEALPPTFQKLFKYSVASGTAVAVDVIVLAVLRGLLGVPGLTAHLIAVCTSSVPNYLINRRWTWQQSGKNRLWGEVVPFWVMAFLGLVLSTIFVAYADSRWDSTIITIAANLSGFGVLWILKFLVLDKLMWKVVQDLQPDVDIDEAEAVAPPAL